jgi:tRNA threonylcarbamoyl adenosine modification protein YeaZ
MSLETTQNIYVLAIESAVAGGSIAFTSNGSSLAEWIGSSEKPQAEVILEQISLLLDKVRIHPEDVGLVAVSAGPGSFTGIRIGVSTALGFASGIGKMCISVDLIKALAIDYLHDARGSIYLPMGRERAITQQLEILEGKVTPTSKAEIVHTSDIRSRIRSANIYGRHLFHPTLAEHFSDNISSQAISINLAASVARYATSPFVEVSTPIFVSYNSE